MSVKIFSKKDLKAYCKANLNKFIILIHENVYDITKFIDEVCSY